MTVPRELEVRIRQLHFGEKWPVGTIAKQLEIHEDVVRRVLGLLEPRRKPRARPKLIAPFLAFIMEILFRYPTLRATRLYDMLKARGYVGSVRTVREAVRPLRPKPKHEAYLTVTPLIGEQAQVDWAHVGKVQVDGTMRSLWLFVILLRWSRALWGEFVYDLRAPAVARSLVRSSVYFGGSPRQWLFDNPKTIVLERYADAVRFHPLILDIAGAMHVELRVCRPRRPTDKAGVERAIRYLRDRFLAAREISSLEQGNRELLQFIAEIAHPRPHPDLSERSVGECFEEEKGYLLALPEYPPSTDEVVPVSVDKTAFVRFDKNRYSVPPKYAAEKLSLVADDTTVRLVDGDLEVARHTRCWGKNRKVEDRAHRQAIERMKKAARESRGRDRLLCTVPEVEVLFRRWIESDRNIGSMIAQTLKLLDLYGAELFKEAVLEVVERGTHDPGALAISCEQRRRAKAQPLPIDVELSPHVPDDDVIPHDLEDYDEE